MNGEELAVLTTAENKSIYEQTSFEIYKLHEAIGVIGQFFNGSPSALERINANRCRIITQTDETTRTYSLGDLVNKVTDTAPAQLLWANRLEKNPQDPEIILLPTAEIVGGKKTVHLEAVFGKAHLSIIVEDDHKEFLHIPEFLIQSSSMKYPFVDVTNSGLGRLYLDQLKAISRLLQRPLKLEPSNENALRFYMKQGFSAFTKELDVYKKRDESLYHAHELSISQHDLNSLINYYKTEAKAIIDEAPEIEVTLEQALARAKIYDKLRPEFRLKNFFLDQISLIWDPEK